MNKPLTLSLFGKLEISRDGQPIDGFISTKAEALLCYLALTRRPQDREVLAGLLWGDKPETKAKTSLRKVLSNLNQLLGEALIITRQTVTFNRADAYWLDVEVFEAALLDPNPKHLQPLREAIELYQGDFLEGFSVRQALAFEEWLLAERERLRQLAIQTLHRLSTAYTIRGEYAAAIDYCNRLLALEPWREESHQQMMMLLARTGQQSAALAQYETCRRILAEALDIEPLPETTALYQRLKARGQVAPHNLPPQTTPFIGRETELARIAHYLDQPTCRLLSLVGPGGMGKTRLALQAALKHLSTFKDGVFFVGLAGVTSAELLISTIAEVLTIPLSGPLSPLKQVTQHLAAQEVLLVLDNFEHLIVAARHLAEIVVETRHVKLLVTSRERLNLREEWVLELVGLSYPPLALTHPHPEQALISLDSYSAAALFVQHAQRVQADFTISVTNQEDIARICHLVNGMPLGLELAASWIPMLSCAEIVAEIERDLGFLTSIAPDIPERHRSMRAVFESSWNLLTDLEKDVLKKLSVFRGGFQREAALEVTGTSLQTLLALMGKSLLRRDASGCYDIHELLRQFAAEKLVDDPNDLEALLTQLGTRTRHCQYYLTFLLKQEVRLKGGEQQEALQEISGLLENILVAWQWGINQGQFSEIEQAGESLFLFYEIQSRLLEGEELLQKTILLLETYDDLLDEGQERAKRRLLAQLFAYKGRFLYCQGNYQAAQEVLEQSLALFRQLNSSAQIAFALHSLALVAVMQGEYEQAKRFSEESLSRCERLGDQWGTAWSLYGLGWAAYYLGEYDLAEQFTKKSLKLHRRLGNRQGEAHCLNTLGLIVCAVNEYSLTEHPEARRFFEGSLVIRQAIGDRWGETTAWHNLGYVHFKMQDYEAAATYFITSLSLSKAIGTLQLVAGTSMWLGVVALELEDYDKARRYFAEALQISHEQGGVVRIMDILFRFGDLLRREEQIERAIEYFSFVQHHPATDDRVRDGSSVYLIQLSTQLSVAHMAAAEERGQSRTLEELVADVFNEGQTLRIQQAQPSDLSP
jgi:DNA-binding SARP family transcriptional activator/predicted ATPase/Tfp pilus assembly protein PilF